MDDHDQAEDVAGAEDELVSAVLDDVATDEERERVESDPVLRRRLDDFATVRSILGTDAPRFAADRPAPELAAPPSPPVTDSRGPSSPTPRRLRAVAAAAAVLVVAGLGALLLADRGVGDDEAATSARPDDTSSAAPAPDLSADRAGEPPTTTTGQLDRNGSAASSEASDPAGVPATGSGGSPAEVGAALPDLGTFATADEAATAARGLTAIDAPSMSSPCVAELSTTGSRPVATAVVDGTPVLVVASGDVIVVWAVATCAPVG